MSKVSQILDTKGATVLSVTPETTVFEAIGRMSEANVGSALVMDGKQVSGIFTERDYLRKIALQNRSSRDTPVHEVMSSPVLAAQADDSIDHCMALMTKKRCRHLPVMDGDKLLGIVSIGDLVRHLLHEKEHELEQLNSYIAGSY